MATRTFKFYRCKCDTDDHILLDRHGKPVVVPVGDGVRFSVIVTLTPQSVAATTWVANVRGSGTPCGPYQDFATPLVISGEEMNIDQESVTLPFLAIENVTGQTGVQVDIVIAISDKERA